MSFQEPFRWERYHRRPGVWLRIHSDQWMYLNNEDDAKLDEIAKWCKIHDCGSRQSYDMWQFRNESEITVFLLKWS